jgi:hypothetical protein
LLGGTGEAAPLGYGDEGTKIGMSVGSHPPVPAPVERCVDCPVCNNPHQPPYNPLSDVQVIGGVTVTPLSSGPLCIHASVIAPSDPVVDIMTTKSVWTHISMGLPLTISVHLGARAGSGHSGTQHPRRPPRSNPATPLHRSRAATGLFSRHSVSQSGRRPAHPGTPRPRPGTCIFPASHRSITRSL